MGKTGPGGSRTSLWRKMNDGGRMLFLIKQRETEAQLGVAAGPRPHKNLANLKEAHPHLSAWFGSALLSAVSITPGCADGLRPGLTGQLGSE